MLLQESISGVIDLKEDVPALIERMLMSFYTCEYPDGPEEIPAQLRDKDQFTGLIYSL